MHVITASLVTYHNSARDLSSVISSVLKSDLEIILFVIDNSNDTSISNLCVDNKIVYLKTEMNMGFGKAHNIGISKAIELSSDFHLILNPDVVFDSTVVSSLLKKISSDSSIGLIMPRIIYPNGENQYLCKLLPTPFDLFGRRFIPFKKFIDKRNYKYELRFMSYDEEAEIPYLSGCFLFIRTNLLEKVQGFDERYFMYLEDVDLSRKIGELAKLVYYPEATVVHNFEKGSYKNKKLLGYHIKSAIEYFNKWGWIFDAKRKLINKNTLVRLGWPKQ